MGAAFFLKSNLFVLSGCFSNFPQFLYDFEVLWQNKIITNGNNKFEWNYSLTSLGQYFFGLKTRLHNNIWWAVEFEFGLKRHTLKHLISKNGREQGFYREISVDYERLMDLLEPYREKQKNDGIKYHEGLHNEIKDLFSLTFSTNYNSM
jgi:hypothetical protein